MNEALVDAAREAAERYAVDSVVNGGPLVRHIFGALSSSEQAIVLGELKAEFLAGLVAQLAEQDEAGGAVVIEIESRIYRSTVVA